VYEGAPSAAPTVLHRDRPDELVRALRNDNLFWRLTAQRLLVERANPDVVPQLLSLARDRSVDALGLNPGALHALWTLHGLEAARRLEQGRDRRRDRGAPPSFGGGAEGRRPGAAREREHAERAAHRGAARGP
jgi:hypothetical protein